MSRELEPQPDEVSHGGRRFLAGLLILGAVGVYAEIGPRGGKDLAAYLDDDPQISAVKGARPYQQSDLIDLSSPDTLEGIPEASPNIDEEPVYTPEPSVPPVLIRKSPAPSPPSPTMLPSLEPSASPEHPHDSDNNNPVAGGGCPTSTPTPSVNPSEQSPLPAVTPSPAAPPENNEQANCNPTAASNRSNTEASPENDKKSNKKDN